MMRIYLDEDSCSPLLSKLLVRAGHDVLGDIDAGMRGRSDAVQLTRASRDDRVLLSHNHDDYNELHELVLAANGHHPGILMVRSDNDPARDLTLAGIVRAIGRIGLANFHMRDEFQIVNAWR